MAFGYEFVTLDDEEKHQRRVLLDQYAFYSQISFLFVLGLVALIRWGAVWMDGGSAASAEHEGSPSSAHLKYEQGQGAGGHALRLIGLKWAWRASTEVREGWGTYGEWIAGSLWSLWILCLCTSETGNDFLHLTKRFGIVPASLLPFHYLLAMKNGYSAIQLMTRSSHEQLNSVHQILGRILHAFFILHATCYLTYFYGVHKLATRIQESDVLLGLVTIFSFDVLGTSALSSLRRNRYRIFYMIHVSVATAALPLLYFHVDHIRLFIWQTLFIYLLLVLARWVSTSTHLGSITLLPGTSLILLRIRASAINGKTRNWQPGQHVYLHAPTDPASSTGCVAVLKQCLTTNPFTVTSIPAVDKSLVLVARIHYGSTASMAALAPSLRRASGDRDLGNAPLRLEGPYGLSTHLNTLAGCRSVLLLAGGVGATFALPLWRSLRSKPHGREIRFVWAIRAAADAAWAGHWLSSTGGRDGKAEIYISGGKSTIFESEEGIEMEEQNGPTKEEGQAMLKGAAVRYERLRVGNIVDEVFEDTRGRVGVVICGPATLVSDAREAVNGWVQKGRDVVWHAETFSL